MSDRNYFRKKFWEAIRQCDFDRAAVILLTCFRWKMEKKGAVYISSCNILNISSQGYSSEEARKNIKEAVRLFIQTAFEMGTLDDLLKPYRFQERKGWSIR